MKTNIPKYSKKNKIEQDYYLTPDIIDFIETYKLYFDKWNNSEPYKPSFLFRYGDILQKFLNIPETDEDIILKLLLKCLSGICIITFIISIMVIYEF